MATETGDIRSKWVKENDEHGNFLQFVFAVV